MASSSLSLYFLFSLLLFSTLSPQGDAGLQEQYDQKTWCVAKPATNETMLYDNIQFACMNVDCSIIRKDGACFLPNTNISHASVVMNLYYRTKGMHPWNCYFGSSGIISTTNPSYDKCVYA